MTGLAILIVYILLFIISKYLVTAFYEKRHKKHDFTSLKTVTFGDESAVTPNRIASVISIAVIFIIWAAFTGSKLFPIHVPGPFMGDTSFTYTIEGPDGARDDATVYVQVIPQNEKVDLAEIPAGDGIAKDDSFQVTVWRSELLKVQDNDEMGKDDGFNIVAVDGKDISPESTVSVGDGNIVMTSKGTLSFTPKSGLQMQPLYLPSPEAVVARFFEIVRDGYKNTSLWEHIGYSLFRVIAGFALGTLIGIPLGYAMGLSGWFRGWFDPIVEFMRPVPPLALIPLVIIWFGIWESGKVVLLFLAALWIMIIAARSGVAGVNISKIHAAYSLGASKRQILQHVIVPNSLPEIFTGARVAMGVCWGTVVAAELVAAQKGVGMMIISASKFQQTDIVIVGIIIIGVIGFSIDMLMRKAEKVLVPWKGRS